MKLAYFIGTLKKEDGVTRVILALLKVLISRGHQAVIVTGYAEDRSISPVPVVEVPAMIFPFNREYRLALPGSRSFAKILDEFQPDLIHLHSPDTIAWAALRYGQKNKIPVLATYHTDFARYLSYYHLNFVKNILWHLLRRLYNQTVIVTAPAAMAEADLREHGIAKTLILPWGADGKIFNPAWRSESWRRKIAPRGEKIILFVGRLVWEKDFATIVAVDKIIKQKREDYKLVIVGGGLISGKLQELLPGAVFLGPLAGAALSEAYASADIFFFPSATETFGLVTSEAMASGLVPIAASAGGALSLIKDGSDGFLAAPKDASAFAAKIEKILDDPGLLSKIRQQARESSLNFSWEKVTDSLIAIYKNILSQRYE